MSFTGGQLEGVNLGSAYGKIIITTNAAEAINQTRRSLRSGLQGMASQMQSIGNQISGMGAQITAATAPLAVGLGSGLKTLASYDQLMTEISARTGLAGDGLQRVGEFAQEMGAETVFSTEQVLEAFLDLLTSGQSIEEAFDTLPHVLNLAAAGNRDLGRSADDVTDILSQYGLGVEHAEMVTNALAAAAGSSSADVGQLTESFKNVGPLAAQYGLSIEETAAVFAVFAENGIKGAEAGTMLRSMLLNTSRPVDTASEAWERLGTSLYDADGNMRALDDVMKDIGPKLDALSDEERNEILQGLAGSYGIVGLNSLVASDGISEMLGKMDEQASAAEVAAKMMETLTNRANSFKGSVETLMITALEPMLDDIKALIGDQESGAIGFVNALTEWVKINPELTRRIVKWLAVLVAVGPTLLVVGQAITFIGASLAFLLSPVGLVIGALGALGVAYATNFGGMRDFINNQVLPVLSALGTFFSHFVSDVRNYGLGQAIAGIFGKGTAAMELMESTLEGLLVSFGMSRERAQVLIDTMWSVITTVRDHAVTAFVWLRDTVSGMWTAIQPGLSQFYAWFTQTALPGIVAYVQNVAIPILKDIFNYISTVWSLVAPALTSFFDWFVTTGLPAIVNFVTNTALPAVTDFVDFLVGAWALIRGSMQPLYDWFVVTHGPRLVQWWNNLRDKVKEVVDQVKGWIDDLIEAMDRIPSAQTARTAAGQIGDIGGMVRRGDISFGQVWDATAREFGGMRDSGGRGTPGLVYGIGSDAGVEAFVTPNERGEFMANIDKLIAMAAGGGGSGLTINGGITIQANSYEEGRDAGRGLMDELRRQGLDTEFSS